MKCVGKIADRKGRGGGGKTLHGWRGVVGSSFYGIFPRSPHLSDCESVTRESAPARRLHCAAADFVSPSFSLSASLRILSLHPPPTPRQRALPERARLDVQRASSAVMYICSCGGLSLGVRPHRLLLCFFFDGPVSLAFPGGGAVSFPLALGGLQPREEKGRKKEGGGGGGGGEGRDEARAAFLGKGREREREREPASTSLCSAAECIEQSRGCGSPGRAPRGTGSRLRSRSISTGRRERPGMCGLEQADRLDAHPRAFADDMGHGARGSSRQPRSRPEPEARAGSSQWHSHNDSRIAQTIN